MSILSNKDESLNNDNESLSKSSNKKVLNYSVTNKINQNFDSFSKSKKKSNKSINNLQVRNNKLDVSKSDGNILNDYLHSHKFGIQRKKSRRATFRSQKRKMNNYKSINKGRFIINNDNYQEWKSMVYYPDENKKNNNKVKKYNNDANLKIVEKSVRYKLATMRNILQENTNDNDNFDSYFEKISNKIINPNNSIHSNFSTSKSKVNDISNCSLNKSHNNNINNNINNSSKNNLTVNKNYIKSHSLFSNQKNNFNNKLSNRAANLNNNHLSSNINSNINTKYQSEILNNSFKFEKINKDHLGIPSSKSSKKKLKFSTKSAFAFNERERLRFICRVKPLYDSLDDDESEKDQENNQDSILEPSSQIVFFFDLFVFLSSIYCLFYIPLRMALADCFCEEENIINIILLFFVDILYIGDLCLGFFRGYYNFQLKLIRNSLRIVRHYLKTDFIVDLIEAIPIFTYSYSLCYKNKEGKNCLKYNMSNSLIFLKVLTNIKIFKIFKVRNKRKNVTYNHLFNVFTENYFFEKFIDNFLNFSFVFLGFHFFVCLNIFLSKQSYPNWLITNNSEEKSLLYNYIISSYSLIETLTTVGYGDVVCQSQLERIFQIFFLGVGVIAYSYIISAFGNLIKNESQSSINYNNNLKILEEIRVDYPKMPYKLYNKIYHYIEQKNMADKKSDANLLTNSLPFNLKNALLLVMYRADIKRFKFFKNCDNSNFIIQVLSSFVPATSRKNEILMYEGEMIEDIVIIKDGRLSLEAAIDMEDPVNSIKKYFNVNFQGITSAKEAKKLKEIQKQSSSQLIQSKRIKDFDNAKNVLNKVVKKQVHHLLNEGCGDTSILDRTKNDIIKENENLQAINKNNNNEFDYLKHEPITNEKGNFKYIKIIDIRKNENFGGLYMFMRRPSPLTLKVKSKFSELYLLPKKEVFNIATSYNNIWSKIHKKDFHNMLSIKHKTLNILNKYIEINGIIKITPNDVSRFLYAWEDPEKKDIKLTESIYDNNNNNMSYEKNNNFFLFKRSPNFICPSPILMKKDLSTQNNGENNYIFQGNHSSNFTNFYNQNKNYKQNNVISNKSTEGPSENHYCQQPMTTEVDFSDLLTTLMKTEKQKMNNNNQKNDANNDINIINKNNNLTLKNNIYSENKSSKSNNIISNAKNTTDNNMGSNVNKNSSSSLNSNFFNNKQNTKQSYEEGNTFILHKNSEKLLPTLNSIFNENKAEEIKNQMKKSRKKENRKKLFSFGKKTAELFKNQKYSIFLVGNTTNECFRIKSNIGQSSTSLFNFINNDEKDNDGINNYISFCQDKIFLDKISEISSSEEHSYNHVFDKKTLSQESVISFTLQSIYLNINIHTNLKYSENKNIQQKTLNYLSHLIDNTNKGKKTSNFSQESESDKISHSFNNYFSKRQDERRERAESKNSVSISLTNSFINSDLLFEDEKFKTDNLKKKKNSKLKINDKNKYTNTLFSKTDSENSAFDSLHHRQFNLDHKNTRKKKRATKSVQFKNKDKLSLRFLSNNEKSSVNEINSMNFNQKKESKKIKSSLNNNSNKLSVNTNGNNLTLFGESKINNMKTVKNPSTFKDFKLNLGKKKIEASDIHSENKVSSIKGKHTKRLTKKRTKLNVKQSSTMKYKSNNQANNKLKNDIKLINVEEKKGQLGMTNSMTYFAKEEKEECVIM